MSDAPIVLFDGTCTFCNGAVQFIIDRERHPELRFAPLQSDPGISALESIVGADKALAMRAGATGKGDPDSVVLVEDGKVYTHSTAGLRIARRLRWPWSWSIVFWIVPRFLRDLAYSLFARYRYRLFGREESCRVPTPELRARFLA